MEAVLPMTTLDGSEEGPSVIVGYYIQYLDEGSTAWSYLKNKDGGNLLSPDGMTHTDMGLAPGNLPGIPGCGGEQDQQRGTAQRLD